MIFFFFRPRRAIGQSYLLHHTSTWLLVIISFNEAKPAVDMGECRGKGNMFFSFFLFLTLSPIILDQTSSIPYRIVKSVPDRVHIAYEPISSKASHRHQHNKRRHTSRHGAIVSFLLIICLRFLFFPPSSFY